MHTYRFFLYETYQISVVNLNIYFKYYVKKYSDCVCVVCVCVCVCNIEYVVICNIEIIKLKIEN